VSAGLGDIAALGAVLAFIMEHLKENVREIKWPDYSS
jgi:hypothetical protein